MPCFDLSRVSLSSAVMLLKQPVLAILWAAVCVGTLLSQPVWHWEFALGFTVVASFCQHSACGTFLIQPLSLLSEGLLGMEKIPFLFYVLQCAHLTSEHCISSNNMSFMAPSGFPRLLPPVALSAAGMQAHAPSAVDAMLLTQVA